MYFEEFEMAEGISFGRGEGVQLRCVLVVLCVVFLGLIKYKRPEKNLLKEYLLP